MPPMRHLLALVALVAAPVAATDIQVRLSASTPKPVSGRLIVFAQRVDPSTKATPDAIDIESFSPPDHVAIAARDIDDLAQDEIVRVDADDTAWPGPFSGMPAGDYWVQALLDTRRDYGHYGRGGGDLTGPVTRVHLGKDAPAITVKLDRTVPASVPWTFDPRTQPFILDAVPHARAQARAFSFTSAAASTFAGRPITQKGWVLLPPGYDGHKHFPTVYSLSTYSGDVTRLTFDVTLIDLLMNRGDLPPMVWVFPDYSVHGGTHQFVDSVNDGPWETAFITELVPWIESHYAVDRAPRARLLTGHSSGGWSSLWLQVNHPDSFGGAWSTGPDPIDFHSWLNVDIYAHDANAYRQPDGTPTPAARGKNNQVAARLKDIALIERVLGDTGGQLGSFEWTFSPRGDDGRPMPLFDRRSGKVDSDVADAWRRYDIVERLRTHPDARLAGKLHVIVGAEDNYYLDAGVRRLAALPGVADVRILPGRNHNNLHAVGADPLGLFRSMGAEMARAVTP